MTAVFAMLILAFLTVVHEAGHWVAVRVRGGRVLRLRVGRGGTLYHRQGEPEVSVGLLPVGGRIDYDGIPRGTGQAVIAVSGSAANLVVATLIFLIGALLFGLDGFAPAQGAAAGPMSFALESASGWFWVVPGALIELVLHQQVVGLRRAVWFLVDLLKAGGFPGLLYLSAAGSALWASLNLIPIPGLGTDGWHAVRALASAAAGRADDTRREGE